jgi:hypothetical protein
MRSHWRYRLAGLGAAIAVALAAGSAHLTFESATHSSAAVANHVCPGGTHWDNTLHSCV